MENKKHKLKAQNSAFNYEWEEWEATETEYEFAKHVPFLHNLQEFINGKWRKLK